MRLVAVGVSLFLFPAPALSQSQFHSAEDLLENPFTTQDVFGETVVGEFSGDKLPDAIIEAGGKLFLVYGPTIYNAVYELPFDPVFEFDVLPGMAPSGYDALVLSTNAGLELAYFDGSAWTSQALTTGSGEVAVAMDAIVLGPGVVEVAGVAHDSRTVFRLTDPGGTPVYSSFLHPTDVHEIDWIDWESGGDSELALHGDLAIEIVTQAGVVLDVINYTSSSSAQAVIHESGAQRLASSTLFAPNDYLFATGHEEAFEGSAWIGPQGVVSLASGDLNQSTADDLVVTRTSDRNPYVYFNRSFLGLDPTFKQHGQGTSEVLDFGPSIAVANNAATPALADIDGDLDLDVVSGDQADTRFVICRNKLNDHLVDIPVLMSESYAWNKAADDGGTLNLTFDFSQVLENKHYADYQALVWTADDGASHIATTAEKYTGAIPPNEVATLQIAITTSITSDVVYWIDLRCTNPGETVSSSPFVGAFSTTEDSGNQLDQIFGLVPPPTMTVIDSATGIQQFDVESSATAVRQPEDMPCYPPGSSQPQAP